MSIMAEQPEGATATNGNEETETTSTSTSTPTATSTDEDSLAPGLGWNARVMEDVYDTVDIIGEGTYGVVYQAKNKETGQLVALKKIRRDNEKEGFPITAIREIKLLQSIRGHPNIVELIEVVTSRDFSSGSGEVYMVFEYMDHDLTGLFEQHGKWFSIPQIKCYIKQLFEGLYHCHQKHILHRDIKGANLLINNQGELKLADFGLARTYSPNEQRNYTNKVVTLWYRAPELLLGDTSYGPAIDMWSAGCILAELLTKKSILTGRTELEQLELIFKLCGSITPDNYPGIQNPHCIELTRDMPRCQRRVRDVFSSLGEKAVDLIDKLLTLDPSKRLTASQALDHDFLWTEPMPAEKHEIPVISKSCHEYQCKKRRHENANKRRKMANGKAEPANRGGRGREAADAGPAPRVGQKRAAPGPTSNYRGSGGGGGGRGMPLSRSGSFGNRRPPPPSTRPTGSYQR